MQKTEWKHLKGIQIPEMPQEFLENMDKFQRLMVVYHCAIREVNTKLENLSNEMEMRSEHNPIQYISHRVKSPESILGKLNRMGLPIKVDSVWENIHDIAGIRVVCPYLEDIYAVADMLVNQDDVFLLEKKDYIQNPKESGYRSLHLIIETPVFFSNQKQMVKAEIQIRTIAMDFWASLEHQIRYKKEVNIPDSVREDLSRIAEDIYRTDVEMQEINKQIQETAKKSKG